MLTLSICIPSYDRFKKLRETVQEILRAKSDDFEVVIIDNCSPGNIEECISFDDPRLRIVKREKAVYGPKNVGDAILFGRAKYSLLLLDKDRIDGNGLDAFVKTLSHSDVAGGYCKLNSKNANVEIVESRTVERFGYLSKHPSGDFYQIDLLREYIQEKEKILEKDPFPFDIYLAYCASKGKMMYYDKPCVCSALNDPPKDDSDNRGTLTFDKSAGNMYYFPENRNREFMVYVECLNELHLDKTTYTQVLESLYVRTLASVTREYRRIMRHPGICKHYHHEMEDIGIFKMIGFAQDFRKAYYSQPCEGLTNFEKRVIEWHAIKTVIRKMMRGKKHG